MLEHADVAYHGAARQIEAEHPACTFDEFVEQQRVKRALLSHVIVPREFWELQDWNDQELNKSFGLSNRLWDNYQWSQRYAAEFKDYVERLRPAAEHTHLTYDDFCELMRHFHVTIRGVSLKPALPRESRLRPAFGIPVPGAPAIAQLSLLRSWLTNWAMPLMLNKALVVRGGCGAAAFVTRTSRIRMVRCTDHRPDAVEQARADSIRLGYQYRDMSFRVAEMFPTPDGADADGRVVDENAGDEFGGESLRPSTHPRRYDAIIYQPDADALEGLADPENRYPFAPGFQGVEGDLQRFFEEAGAHLTDRGVLIIVTSNLRDLISPMLPNMIEREVKQNRRWVILDYYDATGLKTTAVPGMRWSTARAARGTAGAPKRMPPVLAELASRLRTEIWVLHRVEDIKTFAWLHGIPGARPPPNVVGRWKHRSLASTRLRVMKARVGEMGMEWGDYKARLAKMLQDHSGDNGAAEGSAAAETEEDEVAQSVRMALDPSYGAELSERSKAALERQRAVEDAFHRGVATAYAGGVSPRETFDRWAAQLQHQHPKRDGPAPAGSSDTATTTGVASSSLKKPKKQKKKEALRRVERSA